jgi:hypothetical protein
MGLLSKIVIKIEYYILLGDVIDKAELYLHLKKYQTSIMECAQEWN